jgi:hypothetical protein
LEAAPRIPDNNESIATLFYYADPAINPAKNKSTVAVFGFS